MELAWSSSHQNKPNCNGVEIYVLKGNAGPWSCVWWWGSRSGGAARQSRATFMHLLWAVLEFEGLLKHLKRKRAGSCRGVKEREEGRSQGLRGRRAEASLQLTRDRGGVREGEVKGCVRQVAESTSVVWSKICNPDCWRLWIRTVCSRWCLLLFLGQYVGREMELWAFSTMSCGCDWVFFDYSRGGRESKRVRESKNSTSLGVYVQTAIHSVSVLPGRGA